MLKESICNAGDMGSISGSGRSPEEMATHSSILDGEIHGQRSLVGHSPWSCKESDMTERQNWISDKDIITIFHLINIYVLAEKKSFQ